MGKHHEGEMERSGDGRVSIDEWLILEKMHSTRRQRASPGESGQGGTKSEKAPQDQGTKLQS